MVELKPGGAQIPVTESNKKEYLDLLAQYRLSSSVKQEIEAFAKGSPFLIATPILHFRNEKGPGPSYLSQRLLGLLLGTEKQWIADRHYPTNNCGTHFGSSFLLVFKVASRRLSFCWFSSPRVPFFRVLRFSPLLKNHFQISIDQEFIYRN